MRALPLVREAAFGPDSSSSRAEGSTTEACKMPDACLRIGEIRGINRGIHPKGCMLPRGVSGRETLTVRHSGPCFVTGCRIATISILEERRVAIVVL